MRRVIVALAAGGLLLALSAASALASPTTTAVHRNQPAPVKLSAQLECVPDGGALVTFTVRNNGTRPLTIEDDFHLYLLDKVDPKVKPKVVHGGREPIIIAFVFPAPEFQVIAAKDAKTFVVPMGMREEVDSGVDLSDLRGQRLFVEAEVFFEGRDKPVRRLFSFEECPKPVG